MKIVLSKNLYPMEAIINTSYFFLDRCYISLDEDSNKASITVSLKSKKRETKKSEEKLKDEFMNELLNCSLRYQISRNNKKVREYIIGRALYTPFTNSEFDLLEDNKELDYQDDPLGIAIPWEEKYGKKNNEKAPVQ